jgi:hypothetical protein
MNHKNPTSLNQKALKAIGMEILLPPTPYNMSNANIARMIMEQIPVKVVEVKFNGQVVSVQAPGEKPFNIKFKEIGL